MDFLHPNHCIFNCASLYFYFTLYNNQYSVLLEDKNLIPILARACNIKIPKTIVSHVNNVYKNEKNIIISPKEVCEILDHAEKYIVKPSVETAGGEGILFVDKKHRVSASEVLKCYKGNFIIQEILVSHDSVAKFHPESLNTIRCITYKIKGKIKACDYNVMRIGCGKSRLDNVTSGGLLIGVRPDGSLQKNAMNRYGKKNNIDKHPDTGILFENQKIANFDRIIQSAIYMHSMFPQVGFIDWDFSLDREGNPVLIEANVEEGGGMRMSQWVNGVGAFGDDTDEILQWLSKVHKLSKIERINEYVFL